VGRRSITQSDSLAGQVVAAEATNQTCTLRTRAGDVRVNWSESTSAERLRNLGDAYRDCTSAIPERARPGEYLFVRGLFYDHAGPETCEANHLIFCGPASELCSEPDWWVRQSDALARFLLRAEFPNGPANFATYSTFLTRSGYRRPDGLQDTNSLSRFIYSLSTAFLLTGEETFLQTAEQGADYLRTHFRLRTDGDCTLWHHGLDTRTSPPTPVLGSTLPGDEGAIAAFEQIYALSGLAQLYRANGDPALRADIEQTVRSFDRYFKDPALGSFFSHTHPTGFDPRSPALGINQSRKNWNSVGDHAPAYLFNLGLATGENHWLGRLEEVFDRVVRHFPDYDRSPLVLERFHEDWKPDTAWGWQQNRGVVGHNLKIAWNLVRVGQWLPKPEYRELAERIAAVMPGVGLDLQRGGWYDVLERHRRPGEDFHRFVWHNRKFWWQQEQAILAFMILAGVHGDSNALGLAREASAFYNAFFLDHDEGGIFVDVEANGLPLLRGDERYKFNHFKAGYHSAELAYLAATYHELLLARRPLTLHFRPAAEGFSDGILRVAPDVLPAGSVRIDAVWVNDRPYTDFTPDLKVAVPRSMNRPMIRVRLAPNDA
jgi:mannose/cellobiose epimerase-like protein (N-acyl-D-glucosamine 2-epimerase family)